MSYRNRTNTKKDHNIYTESARRIKKINISPKLSRGGIRF